MRITNLAAGGTIALASLVAPWAAASDHEGTLLDAVPVAATEASPNRVDPVFGSLSSDRELAAHRGGADLHVNENNATAVVQDNVARDLTTGNNSISGTAFSNATGIPLVVQNSGNNVVIQNSTILNLQLQ